MPHVEIQHYPKELTQTQREQLAQAITQLICEHLSVEKHVVSIAMQPIAPEHWGDRVYRPLIKNRGVELVQAPNYNMPNTHTPQE